MQKVGKSGTAVLVARSETLVASGIDRLSLGLYNRVYGCVQYLTILRS